MPRRVRTSCSVGIMRVHMVRMFCTITARFSGGLRKPRRSSSDFEVLKKSVELLLRRWAVVAQIETYL